MRVTSGLWRFWKVAGWQTCLAIFLTALSAGNAILEIAALRWIGWFGAVGGFLSLLLIRLIPPIGFGLPLILGLVANVGFLTVVFLGLSRLLQSSRRPAVEQ